MKKLIYAAAIAALLYGVSGCRSVKKAESVSRHADYSAADTVSLHANLMSLSDSLRIEASDSVSSAANCLLRFNEEGGELLFTPDGVAVVRGLKSVDMNLQNAATLRSHLLMTEDAGRVVDDLQSGRVAESSFSEVSDKETVTPKNGNFRGMAGGIIILVISLVAFKLYRKLRK